MMYEFQHKGTEKLFCHRYQARVVNYFLILLVRLESIGRHAGRTKCLSDELLPNRLGDS
jgi:hypothetical protein